MNSNMPANGVRHKHGPHRVENARDGASNRVCAVAVDRDEGQRAAPRPLRHLVRRAPHAVAVPACMDALIPNP